MQEVGSVSVKIVGDDRDLQASVKRALGELNKLSVATQNVASKLGKSANGLYAIGRGTSSAASGINKLSEAINKLATANSSLGKTVKNISKLRGAAEQASKGLPEIQAPAKMVLKTNALDELKKTYQVQASVKWGNIGASVLESLKQNYKVQASLKWGSIGSSVLDALKRKYTVNAEIKYTPGGYALGSVLDRLDKKYNVNADVKLKGVSEISDALRNMRLLKTEAGKVSEAVDKLNRGWFRFPETKVSEPMGFNLPAPGMPKPPPAPTGWLAHAAAIERTGRNMEQLRDNNRGLLDGLRSTGLVASGLGAALVAPAAMALSAYAELERELVKVSYIIGKGKDAAQIQASAYEHVSNVAMKTKFTQTELLGSLKKASMGGLAQAKAFAVMESSSKLATISGEDLVSTTDDLTNAVNRLSLPASKVNDTVETMGAVALSSNTTVAQLAAAYEVVGPMAELAGVSFEDLSIALGLVGNAGIHAREAGQGLKLLLNYLVKGSKAARGAQEALGVTFEELSSGGLRGLMAQLEKYETSNASAAQKSQFLNEVLTAFNSKAGPKLLSLLSQGTSKYDDIASSMAKVKAETVFDKQVIDDMNTLGGSLDMLRSTLDVTATDFGKFLDAPTTALIQELKIIVDLFNNLPGPIKAATHAVAALAAAFGMVLIPVGGLSLAVGAFLPLMMAIGAAKGATTLAGTFVVLRTEAASALFFLQGQYPRTLATLSTLFRGLGVAIRWAFKQLLVITAAYYVFKAAVKATDAVAKLFGVTLSENKDVWSLMTGEIKQASSSLGNFFAKMYSLSAMFWQQIELVAAYASEYSKLREEMGGFMGGNLLLPDVRQEFDIRLNNRMAQRTEEIMDKWAERTRKNVEFIIAQIDGVSTAIKDTGDAANKESKNIEDSLSQIDMSQLMDDLSGLADALKSINGLVDDLGRQLEKMSAGPGVAPVMEIKHTLDSDYQSLSDALDKVQKAYEAAAKSINENTKLSEQQKRAELASAGGMLARAEEAKLIGEATALGVATASISKALLDVPLYDFNDTLKESKNLLKQYNVSFDEVIKQMAKSVAQLTSALSREADKLRLGTAVRMLSSEFGGLVADIAQLRAEAGQRADIVGGDEGSRYFAEAANKAGAMIEGEMLPAIRSLQLEAYETALGLKGVDKVLYDASSAIEQYSKAANLYANAFPELTYEIREYADQLKKAQQQLAAEKIVASFNETSMGMYEFAIESEKTRKHLETLGEAGKVAASRLAKMPKIETLGQALQGLVGKVFDSVMSSLKAEASQDVKTQAVADISDSIAGAITGSFDAGKLGTAIFNVAMDANKELRNSLLSILGFDVPKVEPVMPKDPRITDYDKAEASLKMFKSSNLAASALEMVSSSAENAAGALRNLTDNILKAGEDSFKRHIKGLGLMSDHREKVISDPGYVEAVSGIEDALKETISSPAISEEAVEALPVSAPQAAMYIPGMPGLGSLMGMVAASVGDLGTAANDAATATTDMVDSVEKVADTMASVPEKVSKFESALTGLFGWFKSLFSSGGSAAEKAAGAAVGGSDKIFNDAMSALDGIGEQAAGQDLAADVGMAGASSAAGVATAASALGTALSAIGAGIVGAATAFFALSGPVQALIVGVAGLALALVALQAGAALMYYKFFELSQQTESYKRFQAALEGATDRVVQALEPFWANLMPLAGLFSYTLDVLLPLAAGFANTETIARMLFEVFKVGAIIVAGAMIAIGHFASMMIAGAVAVLNVFAGIVDVFSNMRHIDKMFYNMMLDANAFLLEGLADLIRVFFDLPTAIGNALKAVSGVIIGGIGLVVLGIEFVLSSFYNAILEFASKLLTFVKFVAGIAEALNLAPEGTAEAVQKLINGISGISYNLSDGLGMAIIEGAQNAFQFDELDGENPISSYMEDVAAGLRDNKEDIPETGLGRSLRDLAGGIQDLSPDLSQMHENFNELLNLDYDEAKERGEFLADLKDTNNEFGEELTNVPQGFKVAAARFRAIAAESMGAGPGRIAGDGNDLPTGTPGNNFYIEMLNVSSDNPRDIAEELEREATRRTLGAGGAVPYNDGLNNGSGG